MKNLMLKLFALALIAPNMAFAVVELRGLPYMATSSPDEFILQGGYSIYGNAQNVRNDIHTRAQQYCSYYNRNAQLGGYRVSREYSGENFNMIDYGWVVHQVSYDLTRAFQDQGIVGYARGFDYINCR